MANLLLIRDLCEEQKITFRELCRRINKSEPAVQSSIRRGSTTVATLEAIAGALGVPAGYFFDGYTTKTDLEKYTKEIANLKQLLAEKERTIQILMDERKMYLDKK